MYEDLPILTHMYSHYKQQIHNVYTHRHTDTHTHALTHSRTHTHTHTQRHTQTHRHTDTQGLCFSPTSIILIFSVGDKQA